MEILALAILVIFSIIGFAAIFFTTFGTLIILIGSIIYAFLTEFSLLSVKVLVILFLLYVVGEIIEYASIIYGAKKFGASNAGIAGAFIGGIAGAALGATFFGVGLIIGAFIGIFLGAFIVELFVKKDVIKSLKAGTGGVLGRLGSIIVKIIIAIVMFIIMAANIAEAAEGLIDGKYKGKSEIADVEVVIKDGRIDAIKILEDRSDKGWEHAVPQVIDRVLESQGTDVDGVTSATYSSKELKSAIDDALTKAGKGRKGR